MTIDRRDALAAFGLGALAALAASPAHAADDDTATEIVELRSRMRDLIRKKDKPALEAIYAERFAHWRDSGKFQPRDLRIADLLDGVESIETAMESELVATAYGPAMVVVNGVSPIPLAGVAEPVDFRWIAVFAKFDDRWQLCTSQATRLVKP